MLSTVIEVMLAGFRDGDRVNDEPVTIKLTPDQAFVLSDWLYEVTMKSDQLSDIVTDRPSGLVAAAHDLGHARQGVG